MRKIQLIFSDLDRTLLRDDKTLSPFTLKVLARCRARGIRFVPATARPPRALENAVAGLCWDGAICHNGGVAVLRGKIIWEEGVDPQTAGPLLRALSARFPRHGLSAEIAGQLYANFDATRLWPGVEYTRTDFTHLPPLPCEKLLLELLSPAEEAVLRALLPETLALTVAEGTLGMIQPRGVEKGRAALALCKALGVPPEETAAFGDDLNDVPLLAACGVGVAVENALPQVKAAADEICPSNQEDGPARWLAAHILS